MKIFKNKLILLSVSILALILLVKPDYATAQEITKEELVLLSNYTVAEVFQKLKDSGMVVNSDLLESAIKSAFSGRETDAVNYAMNSLRTPRIQVIDGKVINHSLDFRLAKKIFQQFSEEALVVLEREYNDAAPVIRCNIIQMLGGMEKQEKAKKILISALSDTMTCDDEDPNSEGFSLRVCDAAYNQLVLRHHLKDGLRNMAPSHKVEDRDYHIGILREKMKKIK